MISTPLHLLRLLPFFGSGDLVSIDVFTGPTAHLRVLFVLLVLAHERRRVLHFNVTAHLSAAGAAQQIVDTVPDDTAPSSLLRNRDSVYGGSCRRRTKGMRIREALTAPTARGRIPSRNGSSARSAARAWTMSVFSASGTCAAS